MDQPYPCPACGFLQFSGPPGTYEICGVCGWEDDHVQLRNPGLRGGANRESLMEAQLAVLAQYPVGVLEVEGSRRDDAWRPLKPEEVAPTPKSPRTAMQYFRAACGESPEYYWREAGGADEPV